MPAHGPEKRYHHQEWDLIAAILRQAISDAKGVGSFTDRRPHAIAAIRADALAFLTDAERVAFFAHLCGAEIATLHEQLLREVISSQYGEINGYNSPVPWKLS